jgi:ABC-type antimicrobial peptide transport system permease subunit
MTEPVLPEIYRAHGQAADASRRMAFVIRTSTSAAALASSVREAVRSLDPAVPIFGIESVHELIDRSFGGQKLAVCLLSLLAGLALVLALIGIYGVTAYFVAQRTSEIGLRIALGAQKRNVLALILGQGAAMIAPGVVVGVVVALAGARVLRSMLYQVSATDVASYAVVAVTLAFAALSACYFPARFATNLNPVDALRSQ